VCAAADGGRWIARLSEPSGQVLTEHHDIDNMYNDNNYLEIREGSQSYTFKIPGPTLRLEGSIELIAGEHGAILINGH
jgi:hypothetical protein